MKEYTDEELLDINNLLDDEEEAQSNEIVEEIAENNDEGLSALEELENLEE